MIPVLFNLAMEKAVTNIPDLKDMEIIGPYNPLLANADIILLRKSNYDFEENEKKIIKSSFNMTL